MSKKSGLLPELMPRGYDSDSDGGLEKKPVANGTTAATAIVEPPPPAAPKPVIGRPRIEGVERDPVSGRVKRPRAPPSERQLEILRNAREKRKAFVEERRRIAEESREKLKKIGVTRSALEAKEEAARVYREEAEKAKAEAEKIRVELEEERKKKAEPAPVVVVEPAPAPPVQKPAATKKRPAPAKKPEAPAKKKTTYYDSSSSDDSSSDEEPVVQKTFRIMYI